VEETEQRLVDTWRELKYEGMPEPEAEPEEEEEE
jgi:hypothetical protein